MGGTRAALTALGCTIVLAIVQAVPPAPGIDPVRVEAAFLRNFAQYVTWPASAFASATTPWCIGVLGKDALGDELERMLAGRTQSAREFRVLRAETPEALASCHIVFLGYKDPQRRRDALDLLKERPVLTVSEAPDFLHEGGIIRFQLRDRLVMSVNLDRARAVSLSVQTPMLEVSEEVLDSGVLRKVR